MAVQCFYKLEGATTVSSKMNTAEPKLVPYMADSEYVHWGGPFSTGMYNIMRLYITQTTSSTPSCKLDPNQTVFRFINTDLSDTTELDGDTWFNQKFTYSKVFDMTSGAGAGTGYVGFSVIYIVCQADTEGEYISTIDINGEIYKIGAHFWAENEALGINLRNKGVELPQLIENAIYEDDLYEEKSNWVLLNNKFKELLINYMDVLGNKGSYKSLFNSLAWFGYDNLVELQEVWKFDTPAGTKYFSQAISEAMTDVLQDQMFNCAKTTYMLLRSLKKHDVSAIGKRFEIPTLAETNWNTDELANEFDGNTTPDTLKRAYDGWNCIWAEQEMRMKMTLLGTFFEQYFMPVHLNLIRSAVEDIDIAQIFKMGSTYVECNCTEDFTELGSFDLDWTDGNKDPDDPDSPGTSGSDSTLNLHLDEVHVVAGLDVEGTIGALFENNGDVVLNSGIYEGAQYRPLVACHEQSYVASAAPTNTQLTAFTTMNYNGIGAVTTGNFSFDEPVVSAVLETNAHRSWIKLEHTLTTPVQKFSKMFFFPYCGDYQMIMTFTGQSGKKYTKIVKVSVTNNLNLDLEFYTLKSVVAVGDPEPCNPFEPTSEPGVAYMWMRTKEPDYIWSDRAQLYTADWVGDWYGTQYIPCRDDHNTLYKDENGNSLNPQPFQDAPHMTTIMTIVLAATTSQQFNSFMATKLHALDIETNFNTELHNTFYVRTGQCIYSDGTKRYFIQLIHKNRGGVPSSTQEYLTVQTWGEIMRGCQAQGTVLKYIEKDIFVPEFHALADITAADVDLAYPIVCRPVIKINLGAGVVNEVPYSYLLNADEPTWEFFSYKENKTISELSRSIQEPFIALDVPTNIPTGYYTVSFRYRWADDDQTITKNTSFRLCSKYTQ